MALAAKCDHCGKLAERKDVMAVATMVHQETDPYFGRGIHGNVDVCSTCMIDVPLGKILMKAGLHADFVYRPAPTCGSSQSGIGNQ